MEFLGEGGGGGEAAGRVFLQALQAERDEVGGDLAVELGEGASGICWANAMLMTSLLSVHARR